MDSMNFESQNLDAFNFKSIAFKYVLMPGEYELLDFFVLEYLYPDDLKSR